MCWATERKPRCHQPSVVGMSVASATKIADYFPLLDVFLKRRKRVTAYLKKIYMLNKGEKNEQTKKILLSQSRKN